MNEEKNVNSEAEKEEPSLEVQLTETKKQLAETSDKYLRVLAEYDNFRKRSIKERDGIYGDAYVDCVKNLLPVIDNVERVLTLDGDEKFMEGLKLIVAQAQEALNKMGVKEIECKSFDPNLHNAVMHIDDDSYGEGEIVEVFQKGYIYGDKVIRYAMVKVAN
ncbi:MAG: nucleotide exchange factor GrpE [Ruminococcaceae bacterium]|nr:nucleotide exchange factor GrpE [Oscillospiraceae bacterium]